MVEVYLPGNRKPIDLEETKIGPVPPNLSIGDSTLEDVPLPNTCDIKEALIVKLTELDGKIY